MSGETERIWKRDKLEEKGETSGKWVRGEMESNKERGKKELVRKSKVEDKTKGTILRQTSSSFTLDPSHSIKHSSSPKCYESDATSYECVCATGVCECLDLRIQLLLYRALMVELVRGPSRSHMVGNSLSLFMLTSVHQLAGGLQG